jgi:hypothetical protein
MERFIVMARRVENGAGQGKRGEEPELQGFLGKLALLSDNAFTCRRDECIELENQDQ